MSIGRPKKSFIRQENKTAAEMLAGLSEKLAAQSRSPNMLAYQPLPKQEQFHKSMTRRRLYIGGNRSGKTTAGVVEDLWWLTHRHPFRRIPSDIPIFGRALAVNFDLVKKILIESMRRWIIPSDLINGSWEDSYNVSEKTLYLANGSFLEFKSYDQEIDAMAGTSRHFIHYDEPPPKILYAENSLRLLDRYDDFPSSGSWWMTYTPVFGMDWTYDEIYLPGTERPDESGISVIEVDMSDNTHLSEEAIQDVLKNLSEDEKTARQHGKYVQLGGNIFKEFGPQHRLNSDQLEEIWGSSLLPPKDWLMYFSLDHGLNAPTAVYWHAVGPDGSIITFHEHYKAEMVLSDHADLILGYEKRIGRQPYFRTGDPAIKQRSGITGTSIQYEYAARGIHISVDSVPKDGSIGIIKMRQHMRTNPKTKRPYWQIFDCPNLDRELGRIHWKYYTSLKVRDEHNVLEQVHKKDDHGFDSCKYFFTFMPDLKPEAIGITAKSDMDPSTLYGAMSAPVTRTWGVANEWYITRPRDDDYDEMGLEERD